MEPKPVAAFEQFQALDVRVGTIVEAELLEGGKHSTHKLRIDFGDPIGVKQSCARLVRYQIGELIGRQVLAVVNFPPRQIGKHMSEVLTLGVPDAQGECVLLRPDEAVQPGAALY